MWDVILHENDSLCDNDSKYKNGSEVALKNESTPNLVYKFFFLYWILLISEFAHFLHFYFCTGSNFLSAKINSIEMIFYLKRNVKLKENARLL